MKKFLAKFSSEDKTGRRDFLKTGWKVLGVVAVAEMVLFTTNVLNTDTDDAKNNQNNSLKMVGNANDFKPNSVTVDRVNKFFLVRQSDGGFLALSLACSHLGCSVLWNEDKQHFECPCHSSSFDKVGNVLNSPAPRPLDYFRVTVEGGQVKVDFSEKLHRNKYDKSQVAYGV